MVLAGVGGRTIQEAQQRISYPEFIQWCKYRARRGSFNVGRRIEEAGAMTAMLIHNVHAKRSLKLHDFMPHYYEKPISIEDAMKNWK